MLGWVWVASHGDALRLEIAWKRLPRAQRIAALLESMSLENGCARASIVGEGE
jgi:putative endonuclease